MCTQCRPAPPRRRLSGQLLGERGAAAVEFALVVPLVVFLLLGIVEYSKAFQVQATLADAAREGVRVMALANDAGSARTAVKSAATTVSLTDAQITVTPASCAGAALTANVTVTVKYHQSFLSGFLGGTGVDLTGTAVMRCGG
ncbi:MAG: tadE [Modestobacter sp.]|jgi:Flp pilus assembly protein TadG|nr:tadE [Modestobacter sp.]